MMEHETGSGRGAAAAIDAYLLGEPVEKRSVVEEVLRDRSEIAAAAPFYRALEAVGARAADEALVALRIVLARGRLDDAAVNALRSLAARVRSGRGADREAARIAYFGELDGGRSPR